MGEGDRVRTAQALRDSDAIKERNARQAEALMAFRKHGFAQFGLGRLGSDTILDKNHTKEIEQHFNDTETFKRGKQKTDDIRLYHEDFTGDVPLVSDYEEITNRSGKLKENYRRPYDEKHFNKDNEKPLLYDYEYITKRGRHKRSKRNVELDEAADDFLRQFISDYDFLLNEHRKEKDIFAKNSKKKQRGIFDDSDKIDMPYAELQTLERDKSIRLLKNKDIITEYKNEDVPIVMLDVQTSEGNIPLKLFATKSKEYLSLIQDINLDFENEIDVVQIPIETLPKMIKEKVKKSKPRTVSLNFDDWEKLVEISNNGRFQHERVKKEDIMKRQRSMQNAGHLKMLRL